jgi:hypothetical protein
MWLLPSLNRPASLRRFFDAYRATGGSTPGAVIIDHADYAANETAYRLLALPPGWFIWQTAGVTQGDKFREVWDRLAPGAWLGYIGDDCVPETWEWDKRLVETLDGTNFVSCDDAWQAPQRAGNCWVVGGKLIRAVGCFFPPGLHHLFIDDVWELIGRATGCWQQRMDVRVRHENVLKGDAPPDGTHRRVYGSGFTAAVPGPDRHAGLWAGDEQVFLRWRAEALPALIAAVAALRETREPDRRDEEARQRRLKSRTVMICTPIARAPAWQYTMALAESCVLLQQLGIRFYFATIVGSSNLPRARNLLAAKFLASDATDLMFIDDDIGWRPPDLMRLLASEHPLIAGVGRRKSDKPNSDPSVWCCHFLPGSEQGFARDAAGNIEVMRVGTGFMRIERQVFEQMMQAHPEWRRHGMSDMTPAEARFNYQFFVFGEDNEGEDDVFCDRWRALGGRIFIDPSLELSHVGEKAYSGAIGELLGTMPFNQPRPVENAAE